MLFQLKQSLAIINFKIKITNMLITSLNQPITLTIGYCNTSITSSYNRPVNSKLVIQKLK